MDNTMKRFNEMMRNNTLSVIYNQFIRMKNNHDVDNV